MGCSESRVAARCPVVQFPAGSGLQTMMVPTVIQHEARLDTQIESHKYFSVPAEEPSYDFVSMVDSVVETNTGTFSVASIDKGHQALITSTANHHQLLTGADAEDDGEYNADNKVSIGKLLLSLSQLETKLTFIGESSEFLCKNSIKAMTVTSLTMPLPRPNFFDQVPVKEAISSLKLQSLEIGSFGVIFYGELPTLKMNDCLRKFSAINCESFDLQSLGVLLKNSKELEDLEAKSCERMRKQSLEELDVLKDTLLALPSGISRIDLFMSVEISDFAISLLMPPNLYLHRLEFFRCSRTNDLEKCFCGFDSHTPLNLSSSRWLSLKEHYRLARFVVDIQFLEDIVVSPFEIDAEFPALFAKQFTEKKNEDICGICG